MPLTYQQLIAWALDNGIELQIYRRRYDFFNDHYVVRFSNVFTEPTNSLEIVAPTQQELLHKIDFTLKKIYLDLKFIPPRVKEDKKTKNIK